LDLFPADEVRHAIENLPEAFLLPLLLSEIDGFTYKEIAEILEVPIGTVMSRLHRGRKALQEALYRYAMDRHLIADDGESNG
jgi:RNA polymerase sigma-70 factor (ECF subfamily)